MKFIVNSTALLRELQKLNGVISSNNTLPILDNFRAEAKIICVFVEFVSEFKLWKFNQNIHILFMYELVEFPK